MCVCVCVVLSYFHSSSREIVDQQAAEAVSSEIYIHVCVVVCVWICIGMCFISFFFAGD